MIIGCNDTSRFICPIGISNLNRHRISLQHPVIERFAMFRCARTKVTDGLRIQAADELQSQSKMELSSML